MSARGHYSGLNAGLVTDRDIGPGCVDTDAHDPERCACGMTGEPVYRKAPRIAWCWWCRRAVRLEDDDAHRVEVNGATEWVCGRCWERSGPTIPVDYMCEDEDA